MDLLQWSTNEGRHWCYIESLKSEESNFSSSGKYSRSSNSSSSSCDGSSNGSNSTNSNLSSSSGSYKSISRSSYCSNRSIKFYAIKKHLHNNLSKADIVVLCMNNKMSKK